MIVLLVDAERPVSEATSGRISVLRRMGGRKPNMATEEQAHLMVQSMEAWFIADKEALGKYYGQGFHVNSLPARQNVEDIPKAADLCSCS